MTFDGKVSKYPSEWPSHDLLYCDVTQLKLSRVWHICRFMCKWCRFMFQPLIYHLVTYFLCEGETILQKGKVGVCGSFKKWGGEATYLPDHVSQKHALQFTDMKLHARSSFSNYICFCNILRFTSHVAWYNKNVSIITPKQ